MSSTQPEVFIVCLQLRKKEATVPEVTLQASIQRKSVHTVKFCIKVADSVPGITGQYLLYLGFRVRY